MQFPCMKNVVSSEIAKLNVIAMWLTRKKYRGDTLRVTNAEVYPRCVIATSVFQSFLRMNSTSFFSNFGETKEI